MSYEFDELDQLFLEFSTEEHTAVNDDKPINNGSSTLRGITEGKTVKQLRLSEALIVPETTSIYEARCQMAANRLDVLLLTDSNALLTGIFTNKDIATRVVANEIDLVNTPVSKVMTKNPLFVLSDTLVVEAVQMMMQENVAQLPVIENDKFIGLVRLHLRLFDEMETMEAETYEKLTEVALRRDAQRGLTVKQLPTALVTIVPDTTTIYEAWYQMADQHFGAVLVTGSNMLFLDILTTKDIVTRVIPCGIDVVSTPISKVMSKKPMFVSCNNLPDEALKNMLGDVKQLLVRLYDDVDDCDFYLPLSLQKKIAQNHKFIDTPRMNDNEAWDGTAGPTHFVHVTKSPYPNAISDKLVAPPPQDVGPTKNLGVDGNGTWDGSDGPSFTPFVHANNSPYPNVDPNDNLVAQPPQHTDVRPPVPKQSSVSGNSSWNETGTAAPGFTPFRHVNDSPYLNDLSDSSLQGPNGNGDNQTINKSSTNIRMVKQSVLSKALTVPETTSIYEACCQMAVQRVNVLVVTDSSELLTGILTIKDIVRVIMNVSEVDLVNTSVSKVMTKNPTFVLPNTPVEEALQKLEGFNQLPVVENGKIIGLFYVTETDLILQSKSCCTVKQLPLEHAVIVPETTTIYETCCLMAAGTVETAVLTYNSMMRGTLNKKDLLRIANSNRFDIVKTPVERVMVMSPIYVSCDTLPTETLQEILRENVELLVIENGEDGDLAYLPLLIRQG